jgi:hypothetical protein
MVDPKHLTDEGFVDTSKISIRPIPANIARSFVIEHHYSHRWSTCSVAFGIYYLTDNENPFFDCDDEKLIGAVVFGTPVGRSAAESFSDEVKFEEVYELTRLVILDGYGKNIESYCIGQCLRWIKFNQPHIKVILSYSDSGQGHVGGIYKATNAYYQGCGLSKLPNYSISLTKDPYNWIHSRTVTEKFKSHNIEHLKKFIGKTFWRQRESGKHRYFWILADKRTKKKILKTLKHDCEPYPSPHDNLIYDIEEFVVEEKPEISDFFE